MKGKQDNATPIKGISLSLYSHNYSSKLVSAYLDRFNGKYGIHSSWPCFDSLEVIGIQSLLSKPLREEPLDTPGTYTIEEGTTQIIKRES
jgi:hypothetical protein